MRIPAILEKSKALKFGPGVAAEGELPEADSGLVLFFSSVDSVFSSTVPQFYNSRNSKINNKPTTKSDWNDSIQ